ncbi:Hypothetical predicted protein [Octopus vulgaris]|uniref:Uncharacterized protein n=1 Tax=Octopus vulgaris TaxID=6645 RepID=A0AA36F4F2_OCTVU|nr:Hypothetical predicted protein [Octopus vulgaris]
MEILTRNNGIEGEGGGGGEEEGGGGEGGGEEEEEEEEEEGEEENIGVVGTGENISQFSSTLSSSKSTI